MQLFSNDLGVDLGTSNVLIYSEGKGVVVREPSVVAMDKNTGRILQVGAAARNMLGRTPGNVVAMRPLKGGVISDHEMTVKMLQELFRSAIKSSLFTPKPRVIVSVPSGVTEVEERSVINAAVEAGARRVYLIEEPLAAALGAGLDISNPSGHMVVDGMPIGDLSAFITYVNQILNSLMMVTFLLMMSSRALASCKRVGEVLDEKLDLDDADAKCKDKVVTDGEIVFKNVSFRYFKNSEDRVLADIDLTIKPGSTVGIIGPTGCGKTTLVSMIPRLYDVDAGQVLVDGVDVRDYSLYNLREGVGMVLQKNVLFSGTIEENLRWGNQDATEEEIRVAAEHAQAHKFVQNFPDGYNTNLDQGGTNVSGGQKQRLCIARALLKSPKILILDDSTSAVDTATEAQIREAFANELKNSTKIIIAQRITSVMDADCIVVMDQGAITGIGTHDELMQSNEEYKEIYISQMESKQTQAAAPAAQTGEVKA